MATSMTNRGGTRTTKPGFTGVQGTRPVHGYENCFKGFTNKINSYKTLCKQMTGPAKFSRPATSTLNTFSNWINKGAIIQTVSCAQVAKWARTNNHTFNTRNPSMTGCKNVLWSKFGKTTIKCIARAKNGQFIVATSPTWKGKPFFFPTY